MSLREKLNEFKNNFESGNPPFNVSPHVVAMMHKATDELRASGILDGVLKTGDKAPEFSLPNEAGEILHLKSLLEKGNLVLTFYRGVW